MDWQSLLSQIKLRHETLVAIQDEIGSSQSQREQRNESLFHVVTEALDGQVKQLSIERDKVIQECKDYITKTMDMRKAMGERVSLDTRLNIQKVFPLSCGLLTSSRTCKLCKSSSRNIGLWKQPIKNVS